MNGLHLDLLQFPCWARHEIFRPVAVVLVRICSSMVPSCTNENNNTKVQGEEVTRCAVLNSMSLLFSSVRQMYFQFQSSTHNVRIHPLPWTNALSKTKYPLFVYLLYYTSTFVTWVCNWMMSVHRKLSM